MQSGPEPELLHFQVTAVFPESAAGVLLLKLGAAMATEFTCTELPPPPELPVTACQYADDVGIFPTFPFAVDAYTSRGEVP
jgi:hypothetical protein